MNYPKTHFLANPASPRETTNRRGHYDRDSFVAEIERVLLSSDYNYYRLEDEDQCVNFLVNARVLPYFIDWLLQNPRLICDIRFIRRQPVSTGTRVSIAALDDADILAISSVNFRDLNVAIYTYDPHPYAGYHRSRTFDAPLRDINFDDMRQPYRGYSLGQPVCCISRRPISKPDSTQRLAARGKHDNPDLHDEPIDAVYTWVDASDERWQSKFEKYVGKPSRESHASELRYLSRDELRFSLRSLLKHAPWIRKIHLVTDGQVPAWLKQDDRISVVSHAEIFPDKSVLPVFNSHAIESCLHRIPGLSERFIYFNDDVFLGRDVRPSDFFGPDGSVKVHFSGALSFNPEFVDRRPLPTDAAFRNTIRIIEDRFRFTPVAKVLHTPHPMLKSVLRQIEEEWPEEIARTRSARVRSDSDLNVTGNLAYYYMIGLDLADWPMRSHNFYKHLDTGRRADFDQMKSLRRSRPKFFCLNLTTHRQVPLPEQGQRMRRVLQRLYPKKARHEVSFGTWRRKLVPTFGARVER